jgi:heme-degrading monooxygenase HmoA
VTYVLVWEFQIKQGLEEAFEHQYGEDGIWSQFFRAGQGYQGTQLLKDSQVSGRYMTIDYWSSSDHYENFRQQYKEEYTSIDKTCESLTEFERAVGTFFMLGSVGAPESARASAKAGG